MTVINVSEELEKATEIALRDHFAGLVLNGIIAADPTNQVTAPAFAGPVAKTSYRIADAMLVARQAVQG
jgi:hypothetical protein